MVSRSSPDLYLSPDIPRSNYAEVSIPEEIVFLRYSHLTQATLNVELPVVLFGGAVAWCAIAGDVLRLAHYPRDRALHDFGWGQGDSSHDA